VTAVSLFCVIATLALVLGLLGVTLRLLRRITTLGASGRTRLPMEVVQRLALGPRQGIAVVRIGSSVVAVSVGEGGIRPLVELKEEDCQTLTASAPTVSVSTSQPRDFRAVLGSALSAARKSAFPALFVALALAGLAQSSAAQARRPGAPQTTAAQQASQIAAHADAQVARADSMIARLAPRVDVRVGEKDGGLRLSGTVGVVVMMGLLTLLPTLVLMMTSFTRILIVLHFLRQALGTQTAPPSQLIAGLALLLTGFVMAPTLSEVNKTALQPWMDGKMEQAEMLKTASGPFRDFMLRQTRDRDIETFMQMSKMQPPDSVQDVPLVVLVSAFVTSELRTAFQIGFALFLPFIVIDVVVSSVLMSMGMFMLPPAMISLPFKLLLFVLVDGWSLIVQSLVASFH
jgi:flagellar biosynthesis protein FliP